jgi:hypothetical protein
MIADFNTMPTMFSDCNRKYFNQELPMPKFDTINKTSILARFEYRKNNGKDKAKNPLKYKKLMFSDCFDFDEKDFTEIMVHEMIHYYLYYIGEDVRLKHGKSFKKMARQLNHAYGLHVTPTIDLTKMKPRPDAPYFRRLIFKILS